jgi:hypothetical protein
MRTFFVVFIIEQMDYQFLAKNENLIPCTLRLREENADTHRQMSIKVELLSNGAKKRKYHLYLSILFITYLSRKMGDFHAKIG